MHSGMFLDQLMKFRNSNSKINTCVSPPGFLQPPEAVPSAASYPKHPNPSVAFVFELPACQKFGSSHSPPLEDTYLTR